MQRRKTKGNKKLSKLISIQKKANQQILRTLRLNYNKIDIPLEIY